MEMSFLKAVSPVDGRYRKATEKLGDYFSEGALIRYRLLAEVEYFIALCNLPLPQLRGFNRTLFESLRAVYETFSFEDAARVKEIEKFTELGGCIQGVRTLRFDIPGYHQHRRPSFIEGGLV